MWWLIHAQVYINFHYDQNGWMMLHHQECDNQLTIGDFVPCRWLPPHPPGGGKIFTPTWWVEVELRPPPSPTRWGWIFHPHPVGGGGAAAANLTHRVGVTHHPWVVGTPARWAETNFPRVSNLHTHHTIWYSSNWNALCWKQGRFTGQYPQAHWLIVNVNGNINQTILRPKDQATIALVP